MERNFLRGLQAWKSSVRGNRSCLGELLGLEQLRRQQDIPAPCHMDSRSMCPGRLLFSEIATLILITSPPNCQGFNGTETRDNVFTLFQH